MTPFPSVPFSQFFCCCLHSGSFCLMPSLLETRASWPLGEDYLLKACLVGFFLLQVGSCIYCYLMLCKKPPQNSVAYSSHNYRSSVSCGSGIWRQLCCVVLAWGFQWGCAEISAGVCRHLKTHLVPEDLLPGWLRYVGGELALAVGKMGQFLSRWSFIRAAWATLWHGGWLLYEWTLKG